jgi:hypothetical protein
MRVAAEDGFCQSRDPGGLPIEWIAHRWQVKGKGWLIKLADSPRG